MQPLPVVKQKVPCQAVTCLRDHRILMKIDFLILNRSPETFHEDVIVYPASAIHADPDPCLLKLLGKLHARKLNPLIRIENLRFGDSKSFSRAWTQKTVSSVVEISQARTYRLNQSIIATR